MIDEHRIETRKVERQLHQRWEAHVLFWLAYVVYRSLLGGVWQGNRIQLGIELLDLPLKMAVSYLAVGVLLPAFRARRWKYLIGITAATVVVVAILRQALWHGLIFPVLLPEIVHDPGFFDLPDLASNLSSIAPVATMMVLLWLAFDARPSADAPPRTAPVPDNPSLSATARLRVQLGSRAEQVDHAEIHYVAADRDYVNVMLAGRRLRMRMPLKEVLEQLPTPPFIRVHRRYLVNLDHVTAHTASQLRVAETWLPIGRTHRPRFREFID